MSHDTPNRLCVGKGDSTYRTHFGTVYATPPMHHVVGNGHDEKVRISFYGGVALELTRATAIELARRLPEAINALPVEPGDECGGAVWGKGEFD